MTQPKCDRVTVTNRSNEVRDIELTSYSEIVLQSLDADRQHPAYGNLVRSNRVDRSQLGHPRHAASQVERREDVLGRHTWSRLGPEKIGEVTYETDRAQIHRTR